MQKNNKLASPHLRRKFHKRFVFFNWFLCQLMRNQTCYVLEGNFRLSKLHITYGQKHFFPTDCSVLLYHYVCDFILFLNQSKVGLYKCTSECSVIRCKGKNKKSIVILVRKSEVNTYHCLLWKPQNCRIQRWCIHLVWIMCFLLASQSWIPEVRT